MSFTAYRDDKGYRMIRCHRCGEIVPQVFGLGSDWTYKHNRNIRLFRWRIELKCKGSS